MPRGTCVFRDIQLPIHFAYWLEHHDGSRNISTMQYKACITTHCSFKKWNSVLRFPDDYVMRFDMHINIYIIYSGKSLWQSVIMDLTTVILHLVNNKLVPIFWCVCMFFFFFFFLHFGGWVCVCVFFFIFFICERWASFFNIQSILKFCLSDICGDKLWACMLSTSNVPTTVTGRYFGFI